LQKEVAELEANSALCRELQARGQGTPGRALLLSAVPLVSLGVALYVYSTCVLRQCAATWCAYLRFDCP
jgi:hypothetical protein